MAVAALISAAGVALLAAPPGQRSAPKTPAERPVSPVLRRDDFARVAREQQNAVVSLHTTRGGPGSNAAQRLWVEPVEEGLGSGVVIDASGLVLTNAHVIEKADVIHVPQLRAGRVVHGWLGVGTLPLNANGARRFGLRSVSDGLYVSETAPGGPANESGLRVGDVLLGMTAGSPISARDLHTTLRRLSPGTRVVLRVLRDGQRIELPAIVGGRPSGDGIRR